MYNTIQAPNNKGADQTVRMYRLICIIGVLILGIKGFSKDEAQFSFIDYSKIMEDCTMSCIALVITIIARAIHCTFNTCTIFPDFEAQTQVLTCRKQMQYCSSKGRSSKQDISFQNNNPWYLYNFGYLLLYKWSAVGFPCVLYTYILLALHNVFSR